MATKYYGIKDNWTDDDVANVIEVASEDGSVSSVKVNGVEYGGGGGGGLIGSYTANVTFIVTGVDTIDRYSQSNEEDAVFWAAFLSPDVLDPGMKISEEFAVPNGSSTTQFVIADNHNLYLRSINAQAEGYYTVSGNAEVYDTYWVKIWGDCTITTAGTQM